jgi:hypoxanthine phosphoribosyltransferase
MKIRYKSCKDLSDCIRNNIYKVPKDIDLIVGIPRSGMLAASMLSLFLQKPLCSFNEFIRKDNIHGGNRIGLLKKFEDVKKVLIVDDTVFFGTAMTKVRQELLNFDTDIEILFACIYAEGPNAKNLVDIYFEDNYDPTPNSFQFYEWNILQQGEGHTIRFLYDLDGVLCKEPPDERLVEEYEKYIVNADCLHIPNSKIGGIVTYRLKKHSEQTLKWLKENNIDFGFLAMVPFDKREDVKFAPHEFKAHYYKQLEWAQLFIESDDYQARMIQHITGKPVYCYTTGVMYG